ncbi:hypothetical protein TPA0907_55430 [Micromonospora humidisoli]|uniref:hypothetical protein n=1 Tax=Micromonospora sp. AKA109 TaxID=2733865 RepID=UPI0022BF2F3D|nr:hypothetical protein [Micromonospora sp. AKA109]GHJ11176.1 hypothetical protein TPA0907_55430 [Micromonospora sp. AKA109]
MHAGQPRPKVFFKAAAYRALVEPLGLSTPYAQAADLGVDGGNFGRICRGQPVSAEFIARVRLRYPRVPYEQLFREEMS